MSVVFSGLKKRRTPFYIISEVEKKIWRISQRELFIYSQLDPQQLQEELKQFPRPMTRGSHAAV